MKKIIICIGTDESCCVRARLSLLNLDDSGSVLSRNYHSVSIEPGSDLPAIRSSVEKDLASNWIPGSPWPTIPDAEWANLVGVISVLHAPDLVAAWEKRRADAAAKADEEAAAAQAAADARIAAAKAAQDAEIQAAVELALKNAAK